MQLGKVPVERAQIATLQIDIALAAEDDRSEAIPLGLVQIGTRRNLVGELSQHGFDWRRYSRQQPINHDVLRDQIRRILRDRLSGDKPNRRRVRAVPECDSEPGPPSPATRNSHGKRRTATLDSTTGARPRTYSTGTVAFAHGLWTTSCDLPRRNDTRPSRTCTHCGVVSSSCSERRSNRA